MTDVLDAFALIALARDEPAAAEVEALLRRGESAMTVTNLGEALDQLHRLDHVPLEELSPWIQNAVNILDVTVPLTLRAVELRARHYRRRGSELSLADCVALAASRPGTDRLATADAALAGAAREEGIDLLALPATSGRRPR